CRPLHGVLPCHSTSLPITLQTIPRRGSLSERVVILSEARPDRANTSKVAWGYSGLLKAEVCRHHLAKGREPVVAHPVPWTPVSPENLPFRGMPRIAAPASESILEPLPPSIIVWSRVIRVMRRRSTLRPGPAPGADSRAGTGGDTDTAPSSSAL